MEKHKQEMKMTDDILDKFLSGEATEEEKNTVMEYMTESDEHLDELMCITEALREHREVDKPKVKQNAVYYRVAAAVAVLIIGVSIWYPRQGWEGHEINNTAELNIPIEVKNMPKNRERNIYCVKKPEKISCPKQMLASQHPLPQNALSQEEPHYTETPYPEKMYSIQLQKNAITPRTYKQAGAPMAASRLGYTNSTLIDTTATDGFLESPTLFFSKECLILTWNSAASLVWVTLENNNGDIIYMHRYTSERNSDTISHKYWKDETSLIITISEQNGAEYSNTITIQQ